MSENINVLIVDDNLSYRKFLSKVLALIQGVEVIPPAAGGRIALSRMKTRKVDLVFLDMRMPGMNGLETLRLIRDDHPETGVIMMSGEYGSDANMVVQALELGALDFLPKGFLDAGKNSLNSLIDHITAVCRQSQGRRDLDRAKRMSSPKGRPVSSPGDPKSLGAVTPARPQAQDMKPATAFRSASRLSARPGRIDLVVIGASTGGPMALGQVIPNLPADFNVPILIVQHMPAFLTHSLAQSLNNKSAVEVREVTGGEELKAGTAYMAQGGKHLLVRSRSSGDRAPEERFLALDDGPPENSVRPSADVLFRSVADNFKGNILAVIMTGMGNDGLKGVRVMKNQGCYCITQSAESCVVYGMPRAVVEAGLSDESVEPASMGKRIVELVRGSRKRRTP